MPFAFEWTEKLSVGDDAIDQQHQNLFTRTNQLLEMMISEQPHPEKVGEVIDFLDRYIEEHFSFEEEYMRMYEYPHLDEHHALHQDFIAQYGKLKERINRERPTADSVIDLENFLGQWLVHHIGEEDKKYYYFIRKQSQ